MRVSGEITGDQPTQRGVASGQRCFGRFVLERLLGRGGMGVVWLARDELLGEDVALKFLPETVRWDPAALAELKAETRRARQLSHPGIVRIHDFVEDASGAAIAMEFIPGRTLTEERLSRPRQVLDPIDIEPWFEALCAALDYAHREARVVHRDLKPSNIMLTTDGRIKVTDFGVSRQMGDSVLRTSQLVSAGGTLLYMSPQQLLGEQAQVRDDIYGLGATLYELFTGKPPFNSGNVVAQIERRRPDRLTERRKQLGVDGEPLPERWERLVAACLAKEPEQRPATVAEVLALLRTPPLRGWRCFIPARSGRGLAAAGAAVALGSGLWLAAPALWRQDPVVSGNRSAAPKPTAPPAIDRLHPSDATRAWAAWNFDGHARDDSGRGWNFRTDRTFPVEDRFGRLDRALLLNGSATFVREDIGASVWAPAQPLSVSVWVRPMQGESSSATLLSWRSERQEDAYWSLHVTGNGICFAIGRLQVDNPDEAHAPGALPHGRWTHLAATSDGRTMRLYRDGREVAQAPLRRHHEAVVRGAANLTVGYQSHFDLERFAGAVDELRLWRRALAAAEIARLADRASPPRFALSRGVYPAAEDLDAAAKTEFGPGASLADWNELRRWHADDTEGFLDQLGFTVSGSGQLVRNGEKRYSESTRHYFVNRFDGRKPEFYKAHDELGGMRLALGSWAVSTQRILVRLPSAQTTRVLLVGGAGPGALLEAKVTPSATRSALAVEWRAELPASGGGVRAVLETKNGRRFAASCAVTGEGRFALSLGAEEQPELARQLGATHSSLSYTVMVRDGKLRFRAISAVGSVVIFDEQLALPLDPADVVSLTVAGVDKATLVSED